jgi:hypothetical protein
MTLRRFLLVFLLGALTATLLSTALRPFPAPSPVQMPPVRLHPAPPTTSTV